MKIKKKSYQLNKKKIIILIPFWAQKLWPIFNKEKIFDRIKKNIPRDFGYIHYDFSTDLLNSNAYQTKNNILKLLKYMHKDLLKLNNVKEREFYLYGQSLGGLFGMILADFIKIRKMVLIAPGKNFPECFWKSNCTINIKEEMAKGGMSLEELKKIWKTISPDFYFKKLSKKVQYKIVLSKKDKAIPYENSQELIRYMDLESINYTLKYENLPHPWVLFKECLWPKKNIDFLIKI